jgi:DNA-directed RNA polymerase sigma subunit (sigma70/sigma32)
MTRCERIRLVLRALLERGAPARGDLTKLAQLYGVSRERVRQLKDEELAALKHRRRRTLSLGRRHAD